MTIKVDNENIVIFFDKGEFNETKNLKIGYGLRSDKALMYKKEDVIKDFKRRIEIALIIYHFQELGSNISTDDSFNFVNSEIISQVKRLRKITDLFVKNKNTERYRKIDEGTFKDDFSYYDFQLKHSNFAIDLKRSANFSSPGAGKTIISYMNAIRLFEKKVITNLIIFGPKSASEAWRTEWKWVFESEKIDKANLHYLNLSEKNVQLFTKEQTKINRKKINVWFINYDKLTNEDYVNKILDKLKNTNTYTIFDEVHYLKNDLGKRHQSALAFSFLSNYVTLLSGTPIPRDPSEAYYIVNLLFPYVEHGSLNKSFFNKYKENEDELNKWIKSKFIRENKANLVDEGKLEPLHEERIELEIDEVEKSLIDSIKLSKFKGMLNEREIETMNKAFLLRRMQASSYPPLLQGSLKAQSEELNEDYLDLKDKKEKIKNLLFDQELDNFVQEKVKDSKLQQIIKDYESGIKVPERWTKALDIIKANNGERLIVWDVFRISMQKFKEFVKKNTDRQVYLINGTVSSEEREQNIKAFRQDKNGILLASPATIAESASFHRECDKAIYLYKNFVGSHWMQSKDRIHRLVKPNEVSKVKTIYNLIGDDESIDQIIMENLDKKEMEQSKIIDKI